MVSKAGNVYMVIPAEAGIQSFFPFCHSRHSLSGIHLGSSLATSMNRMEHVEGGCPITLSK